MKIALLCGGKFSFPTIQSLVFENYLVALGVASQDKEMLALLESESQKSNIDFTDFKDKESLSKLPDWIKKNNPDVVFCICFPYRIPKESLDLLPGKFINFHPGPLPQYAGPMPIFEVLKSMEKESAVSVHIMNEEFDKGPLILNEPVELLENETFGSLSLNLSKRTALAAHNIAQMFEFATSIPSVSQENSPGARYYPKPQKRDTFIQWKEMHAQQIIYLINSCNPWNSGADTMSQFFQFKIVSALLVDQEHDHIPGLILNLDDDGDLLIACIEDQLLKVQIVSSDFGIQTAKQFLLSNDLRGQVLAE